MYIRLIEFSQASLFGILAILGYRKWHSSGGKRIRALYRAAAVFATAHLVLGINAAPKDPMQTRAHVMYVAASAFLFVSIYAFIELLNLYQPVPAYTRLAVLAIAVLNVVLVAVEKPAHRTGPVSYQTFADYIRAYLLVAFAALAAAFLRYAVRAYGLHRARMICLSAGFLALGISGGLASGVVVTSGVGGNAHAMVAALRAVALVAAPLLYLGILPPRWLARAFGEGV